jgi:hypothetical protein
MNKTKQIKRVKINFKDNKILISWLKNNLNYIYNPKRSLKQINLLTILIKIKY